MKFPLSNKFGVSNPELACRLISLALGSRGVVAGLDIIVLFVALIGASLPFPPRDPEVAGLGEVSKAPVSSDLVWTTMQQSADTMFSQLSLVISSSVLCSVIFGGVDIEQKLGPNKRWSININP